MVAFILSLFPEADVRCVSVDVNDFQAGRDGVSDASRVTKLEWCDKRKNCDMQAEQGLQREQAKEQPRHRLSLSNFPSNCSHGIVDFTYPLCNFQLSHSQPPLQLNANQV